MPMHFHSDPSTELYETVIKCINGNKIHQFRSLRESFWIAIKPIGCLLLRIYIIIFNDFRFDG